MWLEFQVVQNHSPVQLVRLLYRFFSIYKIYKRLQIRVHDGARRIHRALRLYDALPKTQHNTSTNFNHISVALRFLTDLGVRVTLAPGDAIILIGFTPGICVPIGRRALRNGE